MGNQDDNKDLTGEPFPESSSPAEVWHRRIYVDCGVDHPERASFQDFPGSTKVIEIDASESDRILDAVWDIVTGYGAEDEPTDHYLSMWRLSSYAAAARLLREAGLVSDIRLDGWQPIPRDHWVSPDEESQDIERYLSLVTEIFGEEAGQAQRALLT